jgi:hypothetical protein
MTLDASTTTSHAPHALPGPHARRPGSGETAAATLGRRGGPPRGYAGRELDVIMDDRGGELPGIESTGHRP